MSAPEPLSGRAADNLRFIREAMERSSTFTSIPGAGGALMGLVAIGAALVASRQSSPDRWLLTWLAAATIAAGVGLVTMALKARRAGLPLTGAAARRFALGMAAPFIAGAAITYQLWVVRSFAVMVPAWLLLYGALFGAISFAVYDLTNHSTLREWRAAMTIVDICWGTASCATASWLAFALTK